MPSDVARAVRMPTAGDVLAVLQCLKEGPDDLAARACVLAGHLLEIGGKAAAGEGDNLARATLLEATRREPHDFVTWGLLGDLAVRRGATVQARRAYGEAARLNPRDRNLARIAKHPRSALPQR